MDHNVGTFQDTVYILAIADITLNMWLIDIFTLQLKKRMTLQYIESSHERKPSAVYEPRIFKTPHPLSKPVD